MCGSPTQPSIGPSMAGCIYHSACCRRLLAAGQPLAGWAADTFPPCRIAGLSSWIDRARMVALPESCGLGERERHLAGARYMPGKPLCGGARSTISYSHFTLGSLKLATRSLLNTNSSHQALWTPGPTAVTLNSSNRLPRGNLCRLMAQAVRAQYARPTQQQRNCPCGWSRPPADTPRHSTP